MMKIIMIKSWATNHRRAFGSTFRGASGRGLQSCDLLLRALLWVSAPSTVGATSRGRWRAAFPGPGDFYLFSSSPLALSEQGLSFHGSASLEL